MANEGREQAEALTGSAKKAGNAAGNTAKIAVKSAARPAMKNAKIASFAAGAGIYVKAVIVVGILILLFAVLPGGTTGIMSNENTNVYLDFGESPPEIGSDEYEEDMYEKEEAKKAATEFTDMINEEVEKTYDQVIDEAKNVSFQYAWDAKETIAHLRREDDEAVVSDSFDGEEASDGGDTDSASDDEKRKKVVKEAKSFVGWSYEKVNTCSGLTARAYKSIGVTLPWMYCMGQYRTINHGAERVKLKDAKPGDLVFFDLPDRGVKNWNGDSGSWPDHVGILTKKYKGKYQMVHSIHSGTKKETFNDNDKYWRVKAVVRIIGTSYEENSSKKSEAAYHSKKKSINAVNKAYEGRSANRESTGTSGSGKVKKVWDVSKETGGNRSVYTYTKYNGINWASPWNKFYAKCYTDKDGFCRYPVKKGQKNYKEDSYVVALGQYFAGSKLGNKYRITVTYKGTGKTHSFIAVAGDAKGAGANSKHHVGDGSWVEFEIGEVKASSGTVADWPNSPVKRINGKAPYVTKIELVEGSFANGVDGDGVEAPVETISKSSLKILSAYSVSINNMEIKRVVKERRVGRGGKKVKKYVFVDGKGEKVKIKTKDHGKNLDFKKDIAKKIKEYIKKSERGETYKTIDRSGDESVANLTTDKGDAIVQYARKFLGTPYELGGTSLTSAIDCSNLVEQVYKHFGITVPAPAANQANYGSAVDSIKKAQTGDLCFYYHNGKSLGHVAIFIQHEKGGKYRIIHADGEQVAEKVKSYSDPYTTVRRLLPTGTKEKKAKESKGDEIADFAKGFVGKLPYIWGGTSLKTGADCSGFVQAIFSKYGYNLPRTSQAQAKVGKKVKSLSDAVPGDIIIYHGGGHVAIYIGGGKVVHESNPKSGCIKSNANYSSIVTIRRIADGAPKSGSSKASSSKPKVVEKKIPYPAFFKINWDMENGDKKTNFKTIVDRQQRHKGRNAEMEDVEKTIRYGSGSVKKRDVSEFCMPMFGVDPTEPYNESSGKVNKSNFNNSDVIDQLTDNTLKLYYDSSSETTSGDLETIGNNPKGKLLWPCQGKSISSPFGYRICPFHGRELHSGADIPAAGGSPIWAAADGVVTTTGYHSSRGNYVIIKHSNSISTLYQHIQNKGILVKKGQKVKKGDKIAKVGTTGSSTGNHLHYEVHVKGKPVNPLQYYKKSQYN